MKKAEELQFNTEALFNALENKQVSGIRANSVANAKDKLIETGYIDPRSILDKNEVYSQVLVEMSTENAAGRIDKHQVYEIFEKYWHTVEN